MKKPGLLVGLAILSMALLVVGMSLAEEVKGPRIELEKEGIFKEEGIVFIQKVKFVDENGEVKKEISLAPETKIEEVEIKQPPTAPPKKIKTKKELVKNAIISKNGKYIGISINEHNIAQIDEKGEEKSLRGEGGGTGEFSLLDNTGKVLWEKRFPEGRISYLSPQPLISDDAEAVVIQTRDLTGVSYTPEGIYIRDIIYVYDKNGSEVLKIPEKVEAENVRAGIIQEISPNGWYLAVTVRFKLEKPQGKYVTRFYDLKKSSFWDTKEELDVLSITNDGIAKVGYFDATKGISLLDIKKYLEK